MLDSAEELQRIGVEIEGGIGSGTHDFESGQVSIYPNPVSEFVNVKLDDVNGQFNYRLTNLTGQTITSGKSETEQFKIDVRNVETGIYIFELQQGDIIINEKILIQR